MSRQVVVGVAVVDGDRVLAARRPGPGGGWEFPGGKVEPGETDPEAAVREIEEELALRIVVEESLGPGQPIGDRYLLRVYAAGLAGPGQSPTVREHAGVRWLRVPDLDTLDWLPADRPFLVAVRDRLLAGRRTDGGGDGGQSRFSDEVCPPVVWSQHDL